MAVSTRTGGGVAAARRTRLLALAALPLLLATAAAAKPGGPPQPPPFMKLKGTVQNRTIGPLQNSSAYRLIDTNKAAFIRNLTISGVNATVERDGIRIRGDASGVRIQNFHLQMAGAAQPWPNLPIGIHIESGQNISISDGTTSGFRMIEVAGQYTNGDGVASERAVDGLTITNVTSTDNTDGGFDLKSRDTRLDGLTSERNGRNYRLWGTVEAGTLHSADPRNAHIWVARGAHVHIRNLIARSSTRAPLIKIDGPSEITVDHCTLQLPPGTQILGENASEGQVHLGAGCS
jgi:hypothetical protein